MTWEIWSKNCAVELVGSRRELFTRVRESVKGYERRSLAEPPNSDHDLRLVDGNFGREYLVYDASDNSDSGESDENLHGHEGTRNPVLAMRFSMRCQRRLTAQGLSEAENGMRGMPGPICPSRKYDHAVMSCVIG
jgi:hypothetical protein